MSENLSELANILRQMEAMNSEIQGSAIVSIQGLPIASALPRLRAEYGGETNDGIISAMSAAIISVSERAVSELARGNFKRIMIEGDEGLIILSRAGNNAILCVLTSQNPSLGMVFLNITATSKKIAGLLD